MHAPVDNGQLMRLVTEQARHVATVATWPDGIPHNVARCLTEYAADRIPYKEDGRLQSIRRPAALILGEMSGDCKSTAVFIAGLAAAAGRRAALRFVQYPDGPSWYSHVYAVVDGTPCDPLQGYNVETPYLRKRDETISL
jgi:hypothetical protein